MLIESVDNTKKKKQNDALDIQVILVRKACYSCGIRTNFVQKM